MKIMDGSFTNPHILLNTELIYYDLQRSETQRHKGSPTRSHSVSAVKQQLAEVGNCFGTY